MTVPLFKEGDTGVATTSDPKVHQITNYEFDERFYQRELEDGSVAYAPSVTHILSKVYPGQEGLTRWIGDVGNERADQIKEQAGEDGSFVHNAIESMLRGDDVNGDAIAEQFRYYRSRKIKRCLKSFMDWYDEYRPEVLDFEYVTWDPVNFAFAGTVDLHCRINYVAHEIRHIESLKKPTKAHRTRFEELEYELRDTYTPEETWIDLKSSNDVHDSHKVQVCAYHVAENEMKSGRCAILHLGNKTKKRYSFLVLDDEDRAKYLEQWHRALETFQTHFPNARPSEETFPDVFTLNSKE